jgi:hypothetical protein
LEGIRTGFGFAKKAVMNILIISMKLRKEESEVEWRRNLKETHSESRPLTCSKYIENLAAAKHNAHTSRPPNSNAALLSHAEKNVMYSEL